MKTVKILQQKIILKSVSTGFEAVTPIKFSHEFITFYKSVCGCNQNYKLIKLMNQFI